MQKGEERIVNICKFITEYQFKNHRTPTMEQIAEAVGTVPSNVYKYLLKMESRHIISRNGREISVHIAKPADPSVNRVPILGSVSCGSPEFTEECFEEYVPLPVALFGKGDFFLLRTHGTSMIDAGIEPDDLVVVKKQNIAEDGDIVVALVDNETTLKRYFNDKRNKRIRLHPENKKMKDIFPTNCYIQGIAQYVIKAL